MKTVALNLILCSLLLGSFKTYTQQATVAEYVNSKKSILLTQKEDTTKVKLLTDISSAYSFSYPDSSRTYAQQAIDLAEKINFERGLLNANRSLVRSLILSGNFPMALDFGFKAHTLAKKIGTPRDIIFATGNLAACYFYLGDYTTCLKYDRDIVEIVKEFYPDSLGFICADMSRAFEALNEPDSALVYAKISYKMIKQWNFADRNGYIYHIVGNAFASNGDYDSALFYYRIGLPITIRRTFSILRTDLYNAMARAHMARGDIDSALWYSKKALSDERRKSYPNGLLKAANMLADIYELENKSDSSLKYLRIAIGVQDSIFSRDQAVAVQNLAYKEMEKQKALAASELELRTKFRTYFFVACVIASLVIAGIVLHNSRQKQLQNMRNSIAADLHDDIGSTLSSISIMGELAKQRAPEAAVLLDSISESTTAMQENMSDIVWAIKSENDRFENVLRRMNVFASEILDAKNIALDFGCDETLATSRLSMRQRKNMYLFFKEAINNAARHANATEVSVRILKRSNHVEMVIEDNGIGFDLEQADHGNGMTSLKRRGEELGGNIKIQSRFNEGTRVQLNFRI